MIQLLNTHTNQFLTIIEGTNLSFEAKSQAQDLKSYPLGFSFDMELANDSNTRDAVLYEEYATGETVFFTIPVVRRRVEIPLTKFPRVILLKDGNPMFIGRMSFLSSTVTKIKAIYKCVPYSKVFENFNLLGSLKDYFAKREHDGMQIRSLNNPGQMTIVSTCKGTESGVAQHLFCTLENNYKQSGWKSFPSCIEVPKAEEGFWQTSTNRSLFFLMTFSVNNMLRCMGIEPGAEGNNWSVAVKANPKWSRQIKMRCYRNYNLEIRNDMRYYSPTSYSEIWWRSDKTDRWELLGGSSSWGVTTAAFEESLRKMKGLKGLKINEIQLPPERSIQYNHIGLNVQTGHPSIDFGLSYGKEYDDGERIEIGMVGVEQSTQSPDYVDVVFDFDMYCDLSRYSSDYTYYTLYKDIPMMNYDFEFFECSASDFLNGLSLENVNYRWLRNPAYFNTYNYKILHGQENNIYGMMLLTADRLESIKKEINVDAPSELRIKTPLPLEHMISKKLNDLGNDPEEVEMKFTSLGFKYLQWNNNLHGCPPFIYDKETKTLVKDSIVACFGECLEDSFERFWRAECSSKFDYIYDYADKSEKYTMTVIGYEFQELIDFEGQIFCVGKWKTSDFNKFEIECYKYTSMQQDTHEDPLYDVIEEKPRIVPGAFNMSIANTKNPKFITY